MVPWTPGGSSNVTAVQFDEPDGSCPPVGVQQSDSHEHEGHDPDQVEPVRVEDHEHEKATEDRKSTPPQEASRLL
jgi:hypothetical protein